MPPPVYPAGSYPALVVAHGASHYWRLGEPSGTTAVDVIGGANGTISGGVTLNQPGAIADGDKAMTFNGTTGKIVTATLSAPGVPLTCSFEVWIKLNPAVLGAEPVIFSTRGLSTGSAVILYVNATTGQLQYYSDFGFTGVRNVKDGQWHHVVYLLLGGATVELYVDGVFDNQAGSTRATPSTGPAAIGWDSPNAAFWDGAIDDIAIYPRALTAPEIAAHYAARLFTGVTRRPDLPFWHLVTGGTLEQFNVWSPVTPSDTVNLPKGISEGLWVGGAGDIAAVMENNLMPVVFAAVPAGAWLPIAAKRINSTGTTATAIIALYQS